MSIPLIVPPRNGSDPGHTQSEPPSGNPTSHVGYLRQRYKDCKIFGGIYKGLMEAKSFKTYDSLFGKWASWCSERDSDPSEQTVIPSLWGPVTIYIIIVDNCCVRTKCLCEQCACTEACINQPSNLCGVCLPVVAYTKNYRPQYNSSTRFLLY